MRSSAIIISGMIAELVILSTAFIPREPPPAYATTSADSGTGWMAKNLREDLGLRQDSVARWAGITASRLSRLERGLDTARAAEQDSLARILTRRLRARVGDSALVRWNRIAMRNWNR